MTDFKAKNIKKNVYETKSFKRKYYDNCIKDYYVITETDRGTGTRDVYITDDDSGHYLNSRHCKGLLAAKALKEQLLKEDTNYLCLFVDTAAGKSFISEESDYSGNWRGSKYGFFSLYEAIKYETREEKLLARQKLEAIAAKI